MDFARTQSKLTKDIAREGRTFRTYRSALHFLTSVTNYERQSRVRYSQGNFNLARMNRLLSSVGNPHRNLKTVHIAGTKGKGSTAAMLSSMLQGCGLEVGVYSSPHVLDIRERITINDTWVGEQEFVKLMNKLLPAFDKSKGSKPTFFELMTAMAFLYFEDKKVDIAVIEAGLGGRLDATNVIKPEVCGITSISFDHVELLGSTLEQIAHEKGGILKARIPAISAPQPPEVKETLKTLAANVGAPISFAGDEIEFSYRFESSRLVGPHTRVCISTPTTRFDHLHVPLLGEHQAINCGVALALLDVLKNRDFDIDEQKAIEGLAKVSLTGRMEIVGHDPTILIDGAHNPASVGALMRTIGQNIPYDSMVVIFGCQQDKDLASMIKHVQLGADKIIFTRSQSPYATDPADLAASYAEQSGNMAQTASCLDDALQIAKSAISSDDLICITGSFYLVGEAKQKFCAE